MLNIKGVFIIYVPGGAADLGAGAEKSRRDLGGGRKKIPLTFRGNRKKFIFFSFDELDDKNCFKIAL